MRDIFKCGSILVLGSVMSAQPLKAQMLASSARQLSVGSLKLVGYYQGTQGQTHTFSPRGGACSAVGGVSFACDQNGDVDAEGSGGMGLMKLIYQPWEGLQYYGSLG